MTATSTSAPLSSAPTGSTTAQPEAIADGKCHPTSGGWLNQFPATAAECMALIIDQAGQGPGGMGCSQSFFYYAIHTDRNCGCVTTGADCDDPSKDPSQRTGARAEAVDTFRIPPVPTTSTSPTTSVPTTTAPPTLTPSIATIEQTSPPPTTATSLYTCECQQGFMRAAANSTVCIGDPIPPQRHGGNIVADVRAGRHTRCRWTRWKRRVGYHRRDRGPDLRGTARLSAASLAQKPASRAGEAGARG